MKLVIVSNIAMDKIILENDEVTYSLGGPPCYCSLTGRKFGADVTLITKFGSDFIDRYPSFFTDNDLKICDGSLTTSPTTKFTLKIQGSSRQLYLSSKCEPISISDVENIKTDCWIISPILDEVPNNVLQYIIKNYDRDFLMLDPQGFTRTIESDYTISIKNRLDFLQFQNIDAIKLDPQELSCISGGSDISSMIKIQTKNNIKYVIFSENNLVHMIHQDKHYWLNVGKINSSDSTGAGDILSSAFTCSFIKERDPLWAFSFGVGAVMAALKTRKNGIDKIPSKRSIEENASYNYNLIKYEQLI